MAFLFVDAGLLLKFAKASAMGVEKTWLSRVCWQICAESCCLSKISTACGDNRAIADRLAYIKAQQP
ncbi:MAG: hypothetical protein IPP82_02175 [Xanthomonadales bacterium]|nr:hypothetical protein [Xanthomonadales bacterium]